MPNNVQNDVTIVGPRQQLEHFRQSCLGYSFDCRASDFVTTQVEHLKEQLPVPEFSMHALYPVPEPLLHFQYGGEDIKSALEPRSHPSWNEDTKARELVNASKAREIIAQVQKIWPEWKPKMSKGFGDAETSSYNFCSYAWGTKWGAYGQVLGLDPRQVAKYGKVASYSLAKGQWKLRFDTAWAPPESWLTPVVLQQFPSLRMRVKVSGEVDKKYTLFISSDCGMKIIPLRKDNFEFWQFTANLLGPWHLPEDITLRTRKLVSYYVMDGNLPQLAKQMTDKHKDLDHPLYEPWVYLDIWPENPAAVFKFRIDKSDVPAGDIKAFVIKVTEFISVTVGISFGVARVTSSFVELINWPGYRITLNFSLMNTVPRDYSVSMSDDDDVAVRSEVRRQLRQLFSLLIHLVWKHPTWFLQGEEVKDNDYDYDQVVPIGE